VMLQAESTTERQKVSLTCYEERKAWDVPQQRTLQPS
jgi:hypothetical protein